MPSIRPHLALAALRRRRAGRAPQDPAPPDRPAPSAAPEPSVVVALPAPAPRWATPPSAAELREELVQLEGERAIATLHGLDADGRYVHDLEAEVGAARTAYVGTAVVEIALLRAELTGRLQG